MESSDKRNRHVPGPNHAVALGIDPETLATLQELQTAYGNVVAMRKPDGRNALLINDADDVRQLLVKNHARYRKGPGFERVKMLLGNGLIVSDGDVWRRSRRMIQPAFSRQNVHRLITVMSDCTQNRLTSWIKTAQMSATLDITREMNDFALELILRCIFSADYERYILASGENHFAFLSKDSARDLRVVMQVRQSRELVLSVINARRARSANDQFDLLSMYMSAVDRDNQPFSDAELLDELVTLIVAGYETSAGTLNWAWYLIATHPEAESALLSEATSCLASPSAIDQDELLQMTYAQQLLEETLRLYPPVWLFTRRATETDALANFDIEEGTDVYLSPYILHRTDQYWPNPSEFDPGRFNAEQSPYEKGKRPYFPFSLGPRRCLGEYFSFMEMKVHLGLLIQKFRMMPVTEEPPELDLGINLRSRDSILLRPVLR